MIGLMTAMSSESNPIFRIIKRRKQIRVGSFRGAIFNIVDRECVLVTSGMGINRAAGAAQALIDTFHPICLVSFGIAGAVHEDLQIGDVIMATHNYLLENGSLTSRLPLHAISDRSQEAVKQACYARGVHFCSGTAITTRGNQLASDHSIGLVNPILEMETAGILHAANERLTPVVVLRSISDGPNAPLPLDLERIMDGNNNLLPGRLIIALLKNPRLLFRSGQILKNSRLAAENAAIAVTVALSQSMPLLADSN
jgi:adenosylhomocysteine nucleosidase